MNNNFYKFTMAADDKPARLDLFGTVGGGFWEDGFDEKTFAEAMKGVKDEQALDVFVNSPGGSVFAGISILNLLKQRKGPVCIYVIGLAASAATLITSAPNAKVIMTTGSMLMVHLPSSGAYGNKEDLRKTADVLEKIEQSIKSIYAEKTKLDEKEIAKMIENETWMTAEEAVAKGFADELDSTIEVENSVTDKFVMFNGVSSPISLFKNAPSEIFNKFVKLSEQKNTIFNKKEDTMTLEEMKAQYPELCAQIANEAKAAGVKEGAETERARIKSIEDMAMPGHEEIVNKAKFETCMTAETLAVEMVKAEKAKKSAIANNIAADAASLNGVNASASAPEPQAPKSAEEQLADDFVNAAKELLKKEDK